MEESFKLLPVPEFITDLIQKVNSANERIFIQAMIVELGQDLLPLAEALISAANRGVNVSLYIDYHTLLITEEHIMHFSINNKERIKKIRSIRKTNHNILRRLKDSKVNIFFINKPNNLLVSYFPKFKRNHIKLSVVDDIGYIGGTNFADSSLLNADFMLRFTDKEYVEHFLKIIKNGNNNKFKTDTHIKINEESDIFIDAGNVNSSIIYSEAVKIIKQAKNDILFISQYLPDFTILHEMKKKKKEGVNITIITQPVPKVNNRLEVLIDRAIYKFSTRLPAYEHKPTKVHAKIIITDRSDNPTLILGSHNYTKIGVIFGTDEIALKTTNTAIVSMVEDWYKIVENNIQLF